MGGREGRGRGASGCSPAGRCRVGPPVPQAAWLVRPGSSPRAPTLLSRACALPPRAADCYAFGVLLWEMASSTHPFLGQSAQAVTAAVCRSERCPLELPPGLPPDFQVSGSAGRWPLPTPAWPRCSHLCTVPPVHSPLCKALFGRCVSYNTTQRPAFGEVLGLLERMIAEAEAALQPAPPAKKLADGVGGAAAALGASAEITPAG